MVAYESKLQRLEERLRVPGTRSRADEIALQELVVDACYGVRNVAEKIEATGKWTGPTFERFAQGAEVELIRQQQRLRELTGDDEAAWEARLARIERGEPLKVERLRAASRTVSEVARS